MYKVAVATTDGANIDAHFTQAREFYIYEVTQDGSFCFVEKRGVPPRDPAAKIVPHPADAAIELLADVDAVLASQIGPGAVASLQSRDIHAFSLNGRIDKALVSFGKRAKLLGTTALGLQCPEPRGDGTRRCGKPDNRSR